MAQQYPLTKQQEGLWVEWRLHPENTSYNTCVKLRLEGMLEKERFEQALRDVVQFFSALRVYFVEENGIPFQRIEEEGEFTLQYKDIASPDGAAESLAQKTEAKEFLEQQLRTPVDLKTFPIIRAGLIKTAEDVHYFIGLVPHMISDGASAILFLEATSLAYNQGYKGLEDAYGDRLKEWDCYFAETEEKNTSQAYEDASEFWRERMNGAEHQVDFSYGQQDGGNANKTGKRVYFDLNAALSKSLKDYSRSQRTTLFSTLVAAFGTLIHRYYGQEDLMIGYPVNIRPPGYKHLFGFFVNIIPIRIDLSKDPSYEELVARVSSARKADKKHQTFPALEIVREIRKSISGFDGRVFNVSMAQTVSRLVNLNLDGIQSHPLEAEYNDVNDDLSLSYEILEDGRIGLWLEYRETLFAPEFAQQMINHMHDLLKQFADDPTKKISEYDLLDTAQQQMFLDGLSAPDRPLDIAPNTPETIFGLIEARAAQTPDAAALAYQNDTITYDEMNARANALARHIQSQGAQTGDKVALCLKRGPDMIISLLAVMKAGCAYVPIPPCYPKDRLAFILKDASCKLVITQSDLKDDFDGLKDPHYIVIEDCADTLANLDSSNLNAPIGARDDAYVIYTSGSTGNPKGVLLTHGNVTPRLLWLQDEIALNDQDVVLQNTDYSFDVSVAEIFWPLSAGAKLILTEAAHYKDPSYIIGLINDYKVTTTCFVPSLLGSLLAVLKDEKLMSLQRVLAAGEALPPHMVKTFYSKCSGDLYNVYGPTEGAIYAAFKKCPREYDAPSVPIGRPLGATSLYVLDAHNRPQPYGVAGELHIGGVGVAQGYLNRDDLTDEKFIADPFSQSDGARLYKTGDLTRFLPNGDIEYLGRIDAQVKIRGFRIELAEIESVIAAFDGITDMAVVDHGAKGKAKRLVAYYVSDGKGEIDIEALKAHIAAKLPEYMLPAFFIAIESIPRLASGKINRRALPTPENAMKKRAAYAPPETDLQKQLVEIWAGILKLPADKIGIHDSFFDIGGDSLMAIQFVCEAEEKGIAFETGALFTDKTIAALSKAAQDEPHEKAEVDQGPVSGTYPLLPRQAKFFGDGFTKPNHWNRFFFFDIDHDVEIEKLRAAFDAVLMHHDNMRVTFARDEGGIWHQACAPSLPNTPYVFTHDVSGLSADAQETKIRDALNEAHASLDLGAAPLIRVVHFKTADNAGKLGIVIHHLLLDMVAARIIFEDLIKSYEALRHNIEFPLAAKTTSAKDWATYLQDSAKEDDFSEALAYWGGETMQPSPRIPLDRQNVSDAREGNAAQHVITLPEDITAGLLQDIPAEYGANIQDFLLASLLQSTKEWTGEDDILFNICGHGRNGAKGYNLSRTAAWVNTVYPIHLSCSADFDHQDAQSFINDVKSQIARVPTKNGQYNILRYMQRNKAITQYPTPEIFFNYVSQIDALLPEGVSFQPIAAPDDVVSSDPDNRLCYFLYIEAGVMEKRLNIHITYSQALFNDQTIEAFGALYRNKITQNVDSLLLRNDISRVS